MRYTVVGQPGPRLGLCRTGLDLVRNDRYVVSEHIGLLPDYPYGSSRPRMSIWSLPLRGGELANEAVDYTHDEPISYILEVTPVVFILLPIAPRQIWTVP